jgi:hypothetical protein
MRIHNGGVTEGTKQSIGEPRFLLRRRVTRNVQWTWDQKIERGLSKIHLRQDDLVRDGNEKM